MIDTFKNEYSIFDLTYECEIEYNGFIYPSVINAYLASITDDVLFHEVCASLEPFQAKKQVFAIEGWDGKIRKPKKVREGWELVRKSLMYYFLLQKFTDNEDFQKILLDTHNQEIVFGNDVKDLFWGFDLITHKGENLLGKLLMQVRHDLLSQEV